MALTRAQKRALQLIAQRSCGVGFGGGDIRPTTAKALEDAGLADHYATGEYGTTNPIRHLFITDAGRAYLKEN